MKVRERCRWERSRYRKKYAPPKFSRYLSTLLFLSSNRNWIKEIISVVYSCKHSVSRPFRVCEIIVARYSFPLWLSVSWNENAERRLNLINCNSWLGLTGLPAYPVAFTVNGRKRSLPKTKRKESSDDDDDYYYYFMLKWENCRLK